MSLALMTVPIATAIYSSFGSVAARAFERAKAEDRGIAINIAELTGTLAAHSEFAL